MICKELGLGCERLGDSQAVYLFNASSPSAKKARTGVSFALYEQKMKGKRKMLSGVIAYYSRRRSSILVLDTVRPMFPSRCFFRAMSYHRFCRCRVIHL